MRNGFIEIKWGAIFIITHLFWKIIEKAAGLHDEHIGIQIITSFLFFVPTTLIYVFTLREKRRKIHKNQMPWIKGFLSGLVLTLYITVTTPLALLIAVKVISPDFLEKMTSYAISADSGINEATISKSFSTINYLIRGTLAALFFGIVTSALVAFLLKPKPIRKSGPI